MCLDVGMYVCVYTAHSAALKLGSLDPDRILLAELEVDVPQRDAQRLCSGVCVFA
jgi:hypothetical protein